MAKLANFLAITVFVAPLSGCNPFATANIEIPPDPKPILADRDAVAKCLPDNVRLSTRSWVGIAFNGGRWATLEERLAEVGAHIDQDGTLRDFDGKQILVEREWFSDVCPPDFYKPSPEEMEAQEKRREAQEKRQIELDKNFRVIRVGMCDCD
jgi:hypothetical protein